MQNQLERPGMAGDCFDHEGKVNAQQTLFNMGVSNKCTVTIRGDAYCLKTPYDPAAVASIKNLPASDRRYDPQDKVWLISLNQGKRIVDLVQLYFGETVVLPSIVKVPPQKEQRIIECHYIGQCKNPDGTESRANGCDQNNNWIYVFPEQVLRTFFDGTSEDNTPKQSDTLYSVLGVQQGVTQEDIRVGYRRMAKSWHPDICKEPNAHQVFLRIQEAYEILSMPGKKARYDAGLAFEATLGKQVSKEMWIDSANYRSPLRCGMIMCDGIETLGKFKVSKIILWQDVFNKFGQVLVSSWVMGGKEPVKVWA
jgi:hypothetical protein